MRTTPSAPRASHRGTHPRHEPRPRCSTCWVTHDRFVQQGALRELHPRAVAVAEAVAAPRGPHTVPSVSLELVAHAPLRHAKSVRPREPEPPFEHAVSWFAHWLLSQNGRPGSLKVSQNPMEICPQLAHGPPPNPHWSRLFPG